MNDINKNRMVRKLNDTSWKKNYLTSNDVSMLGYGCDVSQYIQLYDQELDRYQVSAHPYRGSFKGFPGDNCVQEK